MIWVPIVQVAIFTTYLVVTFRKFGVLSSISASWYAWGEVKQSRLFDVFCAGVGLPMLSYGQIGYKPLTVALFVGAGFFMCMIAAAPLFRVKSVATLHYIFAILAIALGFGALMAEYWGTAWAYLPVALYVFTFLSLLLLQVNNQTTWNEVSAFVLIFGTIILGMISKYLWTCCH